MHIYRSWAKVGNYLSLVKFAHSIFAMPFALIGFFLGVMQSKAALSWKLLILVIVCMVLARNAAMSFNRWADRHFDKMNPRTATREIPSEKISSSSALMFCIINALLFMAATWFINPLCFYLSPVALLVILGYSYTKRFTALAHFVLGLGLALAPTGAYLAVTGQFAWAPVLLSFAVLAWVSGFDIIYALQDDDFDRSQQLKSIPVLLGRKRALFLSTILHFTSIVLLAALGWYSNLTFLYWIGFGIFTLLVVYQHTLVKPNDLHKVNLAFFTLNGIASVIFAVFTIAGLLL